MTNDRTRQEFVDAARRRYRKPGELQVEPEAHASIIGDGAFVNVTVWVPNADVDALRQERAFNKQ